MEYFTADTYKNWERIGEPFEKNGRLYTKVKEDCSRCGGTGIYKWGAVINGVPQYMDICFKCDGRKFFQKEVRLYTEKELEALNKAKANRQEKVDAARRLSVEEKAAKKQAEWMEWNGFNEEGTTFVVLGNTFEVKDDLKDAGCKFSKELKWHCAHSIEAPEGCTVIEVPFKKVFQWCGYAWTPDFTGAEFMKALEAENRPASNSEFIGEIGERLRNIDCTFEREWYNNQYGFYVYTFSDGKNKYSWSTSKVLPPSLEVGAEVSLTGTVKDHREFLGVKTTCLNRCLIKSK